MKYKSTLLPAAKEDIREAAIWYNGRQKGLGKRFTGEVRDRVKVISQIPYSFNVRYDNVQTAVLNIFPFMIHYVIEEESRTVVISAVLHTRRNPDLWNDR